MPTLHAVYDLEWSPITFDVMYFLAMAHLVTVREGFDDFTVTYLHGDDGWRKRTPKDRALPDDEKQWRLNNIHIPLAGLARKCVGHGAARRRDFAPIAKSLERKMLFPRGYRVDRPVYQFVVMLLLEDDPTPEEMRVLEPTTAAISKVDHWLEARRIRKPVTLTLRTSRSEPERNSRMKDWVAAAKVIKDRGYDPVIVPDTDLATVGVTDFGEIAGFPLGALSVDLRLAIYRRALLNLSHGGGPGFLPWFSDARMLAFLPVESLPVSARGSLSGMAQLLGTAVGGDWPNATPLRRFVWKPATVEAIIGEFDAAVAALPAT